MSAERIRGRPVGDRLELTCDICGDSDLVDATPTAAFLDAMERFVSEHATCERGLAVG